MWCVSFATAYGFFIPLNLKCTKHLDVSERVTDFVIPFGAVMNMNGTAIYEAVAVVFASQVFGIHLTVAQQIMVMVTAVLASIGTTGIPGSGLVMLIIVFNAADLPLETIALLAGIDRVLNMTLVIPNIVGDAAAAIMVANSEGELHPELVTAEADYDYSIKFVYNNFPWPNPTPEEYAALLSRAESDF